MRMWQACVAASLVLVPGLGWGCSGDAASDGGPSRTDSAGVSVVVNHRPDQALDWTFERILDLGGADEGPTAFFRVFPTSIGLDSLGNLYVLDAGNYSVAVFDPAGRHLRSFGRQGQGPGELGFPSDMAVAPDGAVVVYDFARRGLVRFDAEGSFVGVLPLPGPLQRKVVLLNDGRVAAAVTQPTSVADSLDFLVLTLGADTAQVARVRQLGVLRAQHFSCMSLASPPYFAPNVAWDGAGDRLVFNDDPSYTLRIHDHGRLAALWRRDLPLISATLDLAAWEVAQGDSLRVRDCAVSAQEAADKFGYAKTAPIVRAVSVTPEGGVWVRRRTEVPGVRPIDVFDAAGTYVGTLPEESPFPALFRGRDEIITVETDDVDLPHVVIYRIHR